MLERIYVEIGNICNLSCVFCAKTKREKRQMTEEEFLNVCQKIEGQTNYIYLHVLGEPLIHPKLDAFLKIANDKKLPVCITTNGVRLEQTQGILFENCNIIHKISISLHSLEGNGMSDSNEYLYSACRFAKAAAEKGIYVVFRLWNQDSAAGKGNNSQNAQIQKVLKNEFDGEWQTRPRGYRLCKNIFLEYDGVFVWPSESREEQKEEGFCYALSSQAAILVDGTVVPCCLDANADIKLGNIFENSLEEILQSERSQKIRKGFASGQVLEPLCQRCTFARKFKKRNN